MTTRNKLRVGSLIYATEQGLGRLAKGFYDHGVITHPYVVIHPSHPTQKHWYPDAPATQLRGLDITAIHDWLLREQIDVLLQFETPFMWSLFDYCKAKGIKTALTTMYECTPKKLPTVPDLFICPSLLDMQYFAQYHHDNNRVPDVGEQWYSPWMATGAVFLPIPVEVPWRQREKATTFYHHRGHGSFRDRNGTNILVEAWRYVNSPARLIIRSQEVYYAPSKDPRISVGVGTYPYESLWADGDVFCFVEKFNGLSMPLQEARAAGMLVIAGDRFPINTWLPRNANDGQLPYLVKPKRYVRTSIGGPYNDFDEAQYDPVDVAKVIDYWYGQDISHYSLSGKAWAESMSWESLKPLWVSTLENLVNGN